MKALLLFACAGAVLASLSSGARADAHSLEVPPNFGRALSVLNRAPAEGASAQTPAQAAATTDQLATIQRDILWLTQEIVNKRAEQSRMSKDDAAAAEDDITELEGRLTRARLSFIATASDVELAAPESKTKPEKRDLLGEAQELIEPLFDAIRRVSEKPRRIEALKSHLFYLRDRISQIDRAVAGLDHAVKVKTYPAFDKQLVASKQDLLHERDELSVRAAAVERKLNQEFEDHRTVAQIVTQEASEFASTKGKNFLIAFLSFAATLLLLLRLKTAFLHSEKLRRRLKNFTRPFHVFYILTSVFLAIMASVLALHFLNDWFMASLVMLGLFGGLWLLKTVMHHFIAEIRLILNLGTVKQGERVVWMGIPWLVRNLGFRSTLVNESLQGGVVSLPAATLAPLLSREVHDDEPWFPCTKGDYVLLDDGVYGEVLFQSPEAVVLDIGGSRKTYSTLNFLARNPTNFSRGFEISVELVARHPDSLRASVKSEAKFAKEVQSELGELCLGSKPKLANLTAGLAASGSRTIKAWVRADCSGREAANRDVLKRQLHSAAAAALGGLLPPA